MGLSAPGTAGGVDAAPSFDALFRTATGQPPPDCLTTAARAGLRSMLRMPPVTAPAQVILAWLWRRRYGPSGTPRRLVYALPPGSLLEPVAAQAASWLDRLGLAGEVALHVAMGPEAGGQLRWRQDMDRPAIVVGPADVLVSKALNRGYGTGSGLFPIDFALVTSGAQWIIEETRLCPQAMVTLRQVAEFAWRSGTAEPFGLTCMTTSGSPRRPRPSSPLLPPPAPPAQPSAGPGGSWLVRLLDASPGDYPAIAAAAVARHRPGTLSLVTTATAAAAARVYRALDGQRVPRLLLHQQFRGTERAELLRRLAEPLPDAGRIVVVTQAAAAAIPSRPAVVVTETAAWLMTVRGACLPGPHDDGAAGELWWIPAAGQQDGRQARAAGAELARLEGRTLTRDDLLAREPEPPEPAAVLTETDMTALFDTADGAGPDIDGYVRDADDLDIQFTWATWQPPDAEAGPVPSAATPASGPATPDFTPPPADGWFPGPEFRCPVPLGGLAEFLRRDGVAAWRPEYGPEGWTRLDSVAGLRPGDVVVVSAGSGGYDPELGFDPAVRTPVPGCPELVSAAGPAAATRPGRGWVTLDRHSEQTRDQAAGLLAALDASLPPDAARGVVAAAYVHDLGKAHPVWQDALCALAPPEQAASIEAGRPWAKSGTEGRLIFAGGVSFRHELASLLILDDPMRGMLAGQPDRDLVRYLVLAHHGRLRVSVGEPALAALADGSTVTIPPLLGQPAAGLTMDLDQFMPAGDNAWGRTAALLRDRYGPFVLAYLETVVRIADWRASALVSEADQ